MTHAHADQGSQGHHFGVHNCDLFPQGDGGSKPLKGLSSSPDLELLLRSTPQEDEDVEEEDDFVARGQQ